MLGVNSITSKYSGDPNYAASSSDPRTIDMQIPTSTTIAASATAIQSGQSVTLTGTLVPAQNGGPSPTGALGFEFDSNTASGSLGVRTLSNNQAQLTTSSLPPGPVQIIADYAGDTNYSSSASAVIIINVTAPDFSIAFSPSVVNISSPGAKANTALTVTGANGYNGSITFSAASCTGLPSESSCSFSPATITGNGSTTLTVLTTAPSSLVPASRHIDIGSWRKTPGALRFILFGFALLTLGVRARRRGWNLAGTVLVLALLVVNAACGGGGAGGLRNPGTPMVQNQTVTVTATSGTTTHTFTFTLNVN
jgi:hypothetical protein